LQSSQLKRSLYLFRRDARAKVELDGSLSWAHSTAAGRLLFGKNFVECSRVQSGTRIAFRPQDLQIWYSPSSVTFAWKGTERLGVVQTVGLISGESSGYSRTMRLTNKGDSVRVRVIALHDPTSLNYRRERDPPGEIGVNAFNRNDQVVMDDVGENTGVRVVGFDPRPSVVYMTKDKARAAELLGMGELPENSLGMSGSVILLTQHDLDLAPGGSAEVRTVSVYHPTSLELALKSASSSSPGDVPREQDLEFISSNQSVNFAYTWAGAALHAMEGESNLLERLSCGAALSVGRPDYYVGSVWEAIRAREKDGAAIPADGRGVLEASLFIIGACSYLALRPDKKLSRKWYPHIKRAANGLAALASAGLVGTGSGSPEGWRRRIGSGFPTGYLSEVNLCVIRALREAAAAAFSLGKGNDSANLRETSVRLTNSLNERLRDAENGSLALNLDPRGVVHKEMTIDQAIGLSYYSPNQNLSSSMVHRLLERDFETGYGPRCVPSSNALYYNPVYGDGQLGGYWTRAALSHALLAYLAGYPGIGSLQLEKVARLVHLDSERLGGLPGEFPYWLDPDRKQIMSTGSDPVAASRFVETIVFGEAGLTSTPQGPSMAVPEFSQLKWFSLRGPLFGRSGLLFVGRFGLRAFVVTTYDFVQRATRFHEGEEVECPPGIEGIVFWNQDTTLVCLGNTSQSPVSGPVSVPMRSKSLSSSLAAKMEELDHETGLWANPQNVRLPTSLDIKVDVKANSWTAYRLTK